MLPHCHKIHEDMHHLSFKRYYSNHMQQPFQPKNSNNQWVKPCQVRCILYRSRGSFDHSRAWQRTKGGSPRPWVQSHLRYWRRCPPKPPQAQKNQSQSVETKQIMQKTCRNVRNLDKSSGHVFLAPEWGLQLYDISKYNSWAICLKECFTGLVPETRTGPEAINHVLRSVGTSDGSEMPWISVSFPV